MEKIAEQRRGWILAALMLTMMLAAMDTTIVSTAIPEIVEDLGGFTKFSWVFSIYLLAQTVTIPLYGKFADLYGRKKVLVFGTILFLTGSAASGAAWNITALIVFRAVQGLGAGSIMATVNTIAGDIYSIEERAKIEGYLSSIWGVSAILGPTLGGALAEYVNWRWIFFINLPIGLASIFFLLTFFKEKIAEKKVAIDFKGAILIVCTLSLVFVYLLESGQSWPWLSIQSSGLILLILLLSFWTYKVEKKSPEAIMPIWLWKNKTLAFTNLAIVGMGIVMMGPETFLPTFTQSALGLGTIASGLVLGTMSIGWPIASSLSGKLYLSIGFKETSLIGTIVIIAACTGFLLIPKPQPVYLLIADQVLIGAGFGLLSTPALVGIQSMVAWRQRGVVTGANIFARNLGQSLGAAVVGSIFNQSFLQQMKHAPTAISESSTDIMHILQNGYLADSVKEYLRNMINVAMHHIYWGILLFALLILVCIYLVPHRSPKDHSLIEIPQS